LGVLEEQTPEYHEKAQQLDRRTEFDGRDLPIVAVAVYRSDIVTLRRGQGKSGPGGRRKEITMLSDESLRRLAFVANNTNIDLRSMITLTYPYEYPTCGKTCKNHLERLLKGLKRLCGQDLAYLWFLEFQKRGAPHFHILLQVALMDEDRDAWRSWLSYRWYKIVKSGDDKHLLAGTRWENVRQADGLRHYVVKYAAKTYQKQVPEGFQEVGRFWGNSKNLTVMPVLLQVVDEVAIRETLADWPYAESIEGAIPRVLFNAANWWGSTA
jgi:hypothetical protein